MSDTVPPITTTPTLPPPPQSRGKALMAELGIAGCFSWDNESRFLADTINIVGAPKSILEVGFFTGVSSFLWLYLTQAYDTKVTSIDPMVNLYDPNVKHDGNIGNVDVLKKAFPDRFTFIQEDSRVVREDGRLSKEPQFDLMFIDGDHTFDGAANDFQLALDLNVPWVLVDDFVTSVTEAYKELFRAHFEPIRVYNRPETFQDKPIPIVLLRRKDVRVFDLLK